MAPAACGILRVRGKVGGGGRGAGGQAASRILIRIRLYAAAANSKHRRIFARP